MVTGKTIPIGPTRWKSNLGMIYTMPSVSAIQISKVVIGETQLVTLLSNAKRIMNGSC